MAATTSAPVWNDPRVFGPWGEPALIITYGAIGVGKSTAAALAFPDAYTLRAPGGIKGARAILGDDWYQRAVRQSLEVQNITQVIAALGDIQAGRAPKKPVHIDDLSLILRNTLALIWQAFGNEKRYTLNVYATFGRYVHAFREAVRNAGVHVICDCHTIPASTNERGEFRPGGPDTGAPSTMNVVVAVADVLYEVVVDPTQWPWARAYRCDMADATKSYKDRHSIVRGNAPQNMREILLAAGYLIPRPPELAYLDDLADKIVLRYASVAPDDHAAVQRVGAEVFQTLVGKIGEAHAYWAVFDGAARWKLRTAPSTFANLLSTVPGAPTNPLALGSAAASTSDATLAPSDPLAAPLPPL